MLPCLFFACATKDAVENFDETNNDEASANVHISGFLPGDAVTRTALSYGQNGLEFSWTEGDKFAIYPTSKLKEGGSKEDNTTQIPAIPFAVDLVDNNGLHAHISNNQPGVHFNSNFRYTAYTPYTNLELPYDHIAFDYTDQTQSEYVNMQAYYDAGNKYTDPTYKASETRACAHLVGKDILISPETITDDRPLQFYMRHIGAISRFFIKTPVGKKLKIKEVKLIANRENMFYTRGFINLKSHPYDAEQEPSSTVPTHPSQAKNYGVDLTQGEGCQITPDPDPTSATNCLTLKFATSNGEGIWNRTDDHSEYGRYLLAYMMVYPFTYDSEQDNLYIYVVAEDTQGNDVFFRSTKLASKVLTSGYVYQWTKSATEDTPIELTATLQTWQEVASGAIDTTLEK